MSEKNTKLSLDLKTAIYEKFQNFKISKNKKLKKRNENQFTLET